MIAWDPANFDRLQILVGLLAAHAIGDFLLQSTALVQRKARLRPLAFLEHGLVHAVLAWMLCGFWTLWSIPVAVFALHVVIDLVKELLRRHHRRRDTLDAPRQLALFTGDQIAHLLSLFLLSAWISIDVGPDDRWWTPEAVTGYLAVLVFVAGWIVTVRTGSIVIGLAVARYRPDLRDESTAQEGLVTTESRGLEGGGQMIGALERTLTFFFVLLEIYAGIGFLLAAKSILRFGEVNDPHNRREAEYIIIGTFMSFTWALIAASLTRVLIRAMLDFQPL